MVKGSCLLCYFTIGANINKLRCHKYPPNPIFPVVENSDWCGEFVHLGEPEGNVLDFQVIDLGFNMRILNAFNRRGIKTVADILSKTEAELFEYKNFGRTSLEQVRKRLQKEGLFLKVDNG